VDASLVLTVISDDKPGLVESVSDIISQHGGNWVESSMARLSGKFAGILHVVIAEEEADQLDQALQNLVEHGIRVMVERSEDIPEVSTERQMKLDLCGTDRIGIVHDVSQILAERNVNVDDLQTECSSAPMSGKEIFRATAKLGLPATVDLDELRAALEKIASDLMVDISLDDVDV